MLVRKLSIGLLPILALVLSGCRDKMLPVAPLSEQDRDTLARLKQRPVKAASSAGASSDSQK